MWQSYNIILATNSLRSGRWGTYARGEQRARVCQAQSMSDVDHAVWLPGKTLSIRTATQQPDDREAAHTYVLEVFVPSHMLDRAISHSLGIWQDQRSIFCADSSRSVSRAVRQTSTVSELEPMSSYPLVLDLSSQLSHSASSTLVIQ